MFIFSQSENTNKYVPVQFEETMIEKKSRKMAI